MREPDTKRDKEREAFRLPPTVSAAALLEDGSDARFRQLVYDLMTVAARMATVRDTLAAAIGVTGAQYTILMAIARLQGTTGVPVRLVAEQLHVSGAFVTVESSKLASRGLIEKRRNHADGRSVLLRLRRPGEALLEGLAATVRAMNDRFFGGLDRADFSDLSRIAAALVSGSDAALELIGTQCRHPASRSPSRNE